MKKSKIKGQGFEFVEDGHAYYLDGKKMTGVTTILGVIAKPMLIAWAANEVERYIKTNCIRSNDDMGYLVSDSQLETARKAHAQKKTKAGDWGSLVHKAIEIWIATKEVPKSVIIKGEEFIVEDDHRVAIQYFIDWAEANKVKFLASEERVFSRELFVGGTIDFICEIEGDTWIGDVKTGSGIYPEHFFQTAGYQKLLADMALTDNGMPVNIKGHIILNCKKDGTFEEKRSVSNEDNMKAFLSAFELYKIKQKVDNNLI